jgi:CelD/BcsL family acetyltransferase involved in cellulose biosynthesis
MGTSPDAMERLQIADADRFAAERIRWERLYERDPHAHVFLSWAWLRSFLPVAAGGWRIIVLHEGGEFVAALPLAIRAVPSRYVPLARELTFASDPLGDYQGLLCAPGREADALRELTAEISRLRWDRAAFREVVDDRVSAMLHGVAATAMTVDGPQRSAQIALPATWDDYLASVGASTRRNVRRTFAHLHAELPALRITRASAADVDAHVDALVGLNHLRWGGNLARARARYGTLFRNAFANGCLHLVAIWDGAAPIGATAFFLDAKRKTFNAYQTGFDGRYAKLSPGKASILVGIQDAIALGFTTFDFLRGDEDYKDSYTSGVTLRADVRLVRNGVRTALFDAMVPWYRAVKALAVRAVYGPRRTF